MKSVDFSLCLKNSSNLAFTGQPYSQIIATLFSQAKQKKKVETFLSKKKNHWALNLTYAHIFRSLQLMSNFPFIGHHYHYHIL